MRERKSLAPLATFAGGVIAASSPKEHPPLAAERRTQDEVSDVSVAAYDVVVRLPDPVARRWRASVVGADLEPGDLVAVLLRRQQENPAPLQLEAPAGSTVAVTATVDRRTLVALDGLRDSTGAGSRSSVFAALVAEHLTA